MAKKQTKQTVKQPGSMLTQKTYEDYNRKEPSPADPNESKGKVNPLRPNLADESKNTPKDKGKKGAKHTNTKR